MYSTPLKNQGSTMSCVADWYGVFAEQAEYPQGPFSVAFAFADFAGAAASAVSLTPSYSLRLNDPVTIKALTEPQLVVASITAQAVAGTLAYETTVQLSLGGAQTAGCTFPSSIDLVLGDGAGATCKDLGVAMTSIPGQYNWQHTYTPEDLAECGADAPDTTYFKLPMSLMIVRSNWQQSALPSDPTWCFGEKT